MTEEITQLRRLFRALTVRTGIFTHRLQALDRPLAESRLLFEIGVEGAQVRTLRARLDLDSGYLSRLLASLEREGSIVVEPLASDLRIRCAHPTPKGLRELAELDALGDAFAEATLAPLDPAARSRLVESMDQVDRLLRLSATRITVEDPSSRDARQCLEHYFAELDARFEAGFDASLSITADRAELTPPGGAFLVARLDGETVGCGAVKTLSPQVGSIKRMWVAHAARGIGLGRRILCALENQARTLGLSILRLETNRTLPEAQNLYRRNGYVEVAPFNDEPYADFWFEKHLESP